MSRTPSPRKLKPTPPAAANRRVTHAAARGLDDTITARITGYFAALETEPTEPQRALFAAWGGAHDILLRAPTGSGKTLAAALPILASLAQDASTEPQTLALVIAPTRALVDQHTRTLAHVAKGLWSLAPMPSRPLPRVQSRTGDTTSTERARQKKTPPEVLVVTPESLQVLLGGSTRHALSAVRWVLLDEAHQLSLGKRGALLSVTLALLDGWIAKHGAQRPRRIALSATAEPAQTLARWVSGPNTPCDLVHVQSANPPQIELLLPAWEEPFLPQGWSARKLLPALARRIAQTQGLSIVFVSSRPRAERWAKALSEVLPSAMPVRCFHGSMSADERGDVAGMLRRGELRAVVATSSLESGIDLPDAEQVIFLQSPASVTAALQSAGRSNHRPGARAHALIAATDAADLVDALALVRCIHQSALEPLAPARADEDVLVQSVLAACACGLADESLAKTLANSAPFATLRHDTLDEVIEHLCTGGDTLASYDAAHKLHWTEEGLAFVDDRARKSYLRGVGSIVDDPSLEVRVGQRIIGRIEGRFAAALEINDRFMLSSSVWKLVSRTPDRLEVTRDPNGHGPVARWTGVSAPRSELIASQSLKIYSHLDDSARRAESASVLGESLEIPTDIAAIMLRWAHTQRAVSAIPRPDRLVMECVQSARSDTLMVFSFAGSAANEAIARAAAERWRHCTGAGCEHLASDLGLALMLPRRTALDPRDPAQAMSLFEPRALREDLAVSLEGSVLARSAFREVARVSQLVVTGQQRPGGATPGLLYDVLRRHAPSHLLLRALARVTDTLLDVQRAEKTLAWMRKSELAFARLREPSPMSIPVLARASRGPEALAPDDLDGALTRAAHALWLRSGGGELQ
ncbi:MAG: DEAD/DEAH box helicase [Deltaproteobacteria bacterium]|nr:DEAD/DEAH box helicase [Deltaproteobacteria bacterium]